MSCLVIPHMDRGSTSGACVCSSSKWTGDDCSIEVQEDLNLYPEWVKATCYLYFSINALSCVICAGWMHWKRSAMQVKVWQPFFLNLVLFGCLLSSSSIIASVQESPADGPVAACMAFPWLVALGFSITFGTLFAKILRVYRLFTAAARAQRLTVTVKDTLAIICGITGVDVLICTVWIAVDPLRWTREVTNADQFGEPLSSVGYCTSNHWKVFVSIAVWHLLLMGLACCLCYISRNISTQFSGKNLPFFLYFLCRHRPT